MAPPSQELEPPANPGRFNEFTKDGIAYEKDGVKVIAFEVDHGIKPAYGYRIDYDGRSVLLSGDTRLNENVVKYGDAVDVLIHEVFTASAELLKLPAIQHIQSIHTTPSQAGTVFARTRPKLAAYTHVTRLGSPTAQPPSIEEIVAETRQTYKGPLVVGDDLMSFDIGEGGVSVLRRGQ